MKLIILASLVAILSTGCSSIEKTAAQLKDDHATVHIEIQSPWGRQVFDRSNPYLVGSIITNGPTSIVVTGAPPTEADLLKALRALPIK